MVTTGSLAELDTAVDGLQTSVSVIIVSHNGRRYLEGCLESVFEEVGEDGEVILVDNGSRDGSLEIAESRFPQVNVVRNSSNSGFAAGCNLGATVSTGEVLVFLNQDTRVAPGWLGGLVNALYDSEDAGLATSKILLMSQPERIHLCGQALHYTGLVHGRGYLDPPESEDNPREVSAVSGASFAIRRELWEALGGFDESFYMYYEETDLSWRAQLAGYRCRYAPASAVLHDHRPGKLDPGWMYYAFRNRQVMLLKNWSGAALALLSPALLLAELLTWGQALRSGIKGLWAKVRASAWVAAHLGQILRARRRVQQGRRVLEATILARFESRFEPENTSLSQLDRFLLALSNPFFAVWHRLALGLLGKLGRKRT